MCCFDCLSLLQRDHIHSDEEHGKFVYMTMFVVDFRFTVMSSIHLDYANVYFTDYIRNKRNILTKEKKSSFLTNVECLDKI